MARGTYDTRHILDGEKMNLIFTILIFTGWRLAVIESAIKGTDTLSTATTVFVEDLKVKVTGDKQTFIVDMEKGRIITILENQNIYADTSLTEWAKMTKQIMEAMALPNPKSIRVIKRGKGPKIGGKTTTLYEVIVDGKSSQKLYVAEDLVAPEFESLENALSKIGSANSFLREMIADSLRKLTKGLVLKTVEVEGGVTYTSEIREIKSLKLPMAYFTPPKNYRRVSLEEFFRRMAIGQ